MLLKEETLTGGRSLIPPKGRSAFGCVRIRINKDFYAESFVSAFLISWLAGFEFSAKLKFSQTLDKRSFLRYYYPIS